MHKKEFWILTIKCGNKLKHENEAEGPRGVMTPQAHVRRMLSADLTLSIKHHRFFPVSPFSSCTVMTLEELWGWA
jgi:hypothetical protein